MTLEEYKKEVIKEFKKYKTSRKKIKMLMKLCNKDIESAYKNGWKPIEIALPISMGYV